MKPHVLCAALTGCALLLSTPTLQAQTAAKRGVARATAPALAPATPQQLEAAERVYYGLHDCGPGQTLDVALDAREAGYVNVRYGKARYVMKPVLSTTGAIRLEDVRGGALMIQITAKSMLMDVKAGRRLADECVSDRHREAVQAAAAAAAEAAAESASAPAPAPEPPPASVSVPAGAEPAR